MNIYAIYIISDDDRTLLTQNFKSIENISNEQLIGGLFKALQDVTTQVTESTAQIGSIEIGGLSYHVRSFGPIRVVLVTNVPKSPENIIQRLGLRFIRKYRDILMETKYNSNIFTPFKEIISEIIEEEVYIDEPESKDPLKPLGPEAIFNLPHHLQSTALTLVSLKEGTLDEITQEGSENADNTLSNLTSLQEMGYIGLKIKNGKKIYYRAILN
ncbi:MAG: hypothetical protein ACFFDT_18610 [Candidatus Hodarchaeota archaeon]